MKLFGRGITLLILAILLLSFAIPVSGDVAPPPYPDGANIYPDGETTQVRMVSETVDITIIAEESEEFPEGYAQVKAIFHMRNLGVEPETMDVYFPLNLGNCRENVEEMRLSDFRGQPPIRDFWAKVDGTDKETTTIYQRLAGEYSYDPLETDIACWVYFPTLFPLEKEVLIEVSYRVPASNPFGDLLPNVGYGYVLHTGEGWKDTIGSADITVHMPYPITPENYLGHSPDSGVILGREITWHFEDFEPDRNWDINIGILKPSLWKAIQIERHNTQANPQDGEAWGRLGMAYKKAFFWPKGFRDDPAGMQIYQASVDAYTRAVTLKPDDAAWHAGFADLLCRKADWTMDERSNEKYVPCLQELKKALDLDPDQEIAQERLKEMANNNLLDGTGFIAFEDPDAQNGRLVLALESSITRLPPTITARPTITRTPRTTRTLTPTPQPTQTFTPAPVAVITFLTTPTPAEPTKEPATPNTCGSITLPLILIAIFLIWKFKG